ncbi:MAG: CDP-diacylglycerol--glycerol-3-phosphate 3-phosphatidyltransferase [Deltaproteobacteria bacterium RIFCSPLOWO2_02_FULL_44_10]|nr:MAG: CDP-diacylglycerol--glycerol-3-phosphate 3-phosphatidyltransferase [Deltaproteobacteria bacterium RIFCSPHIGHO2_02_FULL_44_16]OGQ46624.1 MAG: CDP-diacylglycerol--glycerol-3-phosphate 3-phosphatidyltransferase [Deltaproteobacteria bacterium RIFCSPLOWO2_02_FULL_44_10]
MSGSVLNVPNIITIARIAIVPVLVTVMTLLNDDVSSKASLIHNQFLSFISALIVAVAMASDCVDGYYARRYGQISTFGKFLDPLADKLLFLTAMIMMVELHRIPGWIVIVFLSREMVVTALRGVAVDRGIIIAASSAGKYKSAFISCATVGLLLHYPFFGIQWRLLAWLMLIPGFILSVASGIHYAWEFFQGLRKQKLG